MSVHQAIAPFALFVAIAEIATPEDWCIAFPVCALVSGRGSVIESHARPGENFLLIGKMPCDAYYAAHCS